MIYINVSQVVWSLTIFVCVIVENELNHSFLSAEIAEATTQTVEAHFDSNLSKSINYSWNALALVQLLN